jgi:hypothetical protein
MAVLSMANDATASSFHAKPSRLRRAVSSTAMES